MNIKQFLGRLPRKPPPSPPPSSRFQPSATSPPPTGRPSSCRSSPSAPPSSTSPPPPLPATTSSSRLFSNSSTTSAPPAAAAPNSARPPSTLSRPGLAHLQAVYEFFLRFVASPQTDPKIAKRYVDHAFVRRLLDLFDSEDPREREYLKTILHRVYGKFMVHRPFIRRAVADVLCRFVFETERHNGVAELLEVLGSVISGFALPLKEEHKLFLARALVPLHRPRCVAAYHRQLARCVAQFVEKDCKLADAVIAGILRYWPVTNSAKEVLLLGELEEVLEATKPPEFLRCAIPLFRQIGRCINSSHFQVAERALFLWNNDHVRDLIIQNRKVILPIIFPSLERNVRSHWNPAVQSLTLNVRKLFLDADHELFEECSVTFQEDEAREEEVQKKREFNWKRLEEVAASKAVSNEPVLVFRFASSRSLGKSSPRAKS
uniref:Serine/threonine protein phosphatase 2A regulatory subunit n=1 Tax=Ananas comosus var. bracteatus TaxID=296719 RepID=A0A6V7NWW9_ANACO|nr:unnamed protein product [Ananas comosus var. bracteatus]